LAVGRNDGAMRFPNVSGGGKSARRRCESAPVGLRQKGRSLRQSTASQLERGIACAKVEFVGVLIAAADGVHRKRLRLSSIQRLKRRATEDYVAHGERSVARRGPG